jgi:hypothetical protein
MVDRIRGEGSVVVPVAQVGDVQVWQAAVRRACRQAGIRVRTGPSNDGTAVWAFHLDHVITGAETRAAGLAAATVLFTNDPIRPFQQLVREEQRKMLRIVE